MMNMVIIRLFIQWDWEDACGSDSFCDAICPNPWYRIEQVGNIYGKNPKGVYKIIRKWNAQNAFIWNS